ncbi:uncharacterized protein L3040_003363 [Drepanopeziza brunnea f. sp. 'multigermtubi']|uniref:uncharacterized protein n=1 Tax=Drepanopeziza brunnea f. sp. 'multigermtubi' TaxID=698441 RepID=UPI00239551FB|nr:hypothetical protein L3040_003363 [Drepanopeziza brunnea f. sp. 'multigermtubi']
MPIQELRHRKGGGRTEENLDVFNAGDASNWVSHSREIQIRLAIGKSKLLRSIREHRIPRRLGLDTVIPKKRNPLRSRRNPDTRLRHPFKVPQHTLPDRLVKHPLIPGVERERGRERIPRHSRQHARLADGGRETAPMFSSSLRPLTRIGTVVPRPS